MMSVCRLGGILQLGMKNMQEGPVSWELSHCVLYSGLNYWHLSLLLDNTVALQ